MNWAELYHRILQLPLNVFAELIREYETPREVWESHYQDTCVTAFMGWCLRQGQIPHLMCRVEELCESRLP